MTELVVPSDVALLDLLRSRTSLTVAEMAEAMEVTATAVRQRLTRLMQQGYIVREAERAGRGRPRHYYTLTAKGRRRAGENFADLAIVLWQEVRQIPDKEIRRGLLQRISRRLATIYADRIAGDKIDEKMESLAELFAERGVPLVVDRSGELPVLTTVACPYPDLAEQDQSVCAMERMMFAELLGQDLRLAQCRLNGQTCCTFEVSAEV